MQNDNTRAFAACGISYDVARAIALAHNGIELDMHDANDVFVNGNFSNVEVERGDMEDIRGVTVNSLVIKQLEDRGWVEVIGHRETVGRPMLYATTRQFLDDLGIASLNQLPPLESPGSDVEGFFDQLAAMESSVDPAQMAMPLEGEPEPVALSTRDEEGLASQADTDSPSP